MRIRGMKPLPFVGRLARALMEHNVTDSAAQLSYYVLFSAFPFLFFLVTLSAFLPVQGTVASMLDRLAELMPGDAMDVLHGHVNSLLGEERPKLLTLGLVVTLWSASRAMDSLRKALNLAYDVKETRKLWKTQAIALGMTVFGAVLLLTAITLLVLGGRAGYLLADKFGVETAYLLVWTWLRWPFTAALVMLVAALVYYMLPDVEQEFRYITPGSVIGTILWLLTTWGFTQYVEHFGNYNATYGSIGGVIVLMLWMYVSGLTFIIGGELNALLEHLAPEGKVKGAREPGQPPEPADERPSAAPPGIAKHKSIADQHEKGV